MKQQNYLLTLYIDARCPLCLMEVRHLRRIDKRQQIEFIDINAPQIEEHFSESEIAQLGERIHARSRDGQLYIGLDAVHQAWSIAGIRWLYAWTRWPLIRPVADKLYLWFARNRMSVSRWVFGKQACQQCDINQQNGTNQCK